MSAEFGFTFPVGGPWSDHYMRVVAEDEIAARTAVIAVHGREGWAGCYSAAAGARVIEKYGLTEILWRGSQ